MRYRFSQSLLTLLWFTIAPCAHAQTETLDVPIEKVADIPEELLPEGSDYRVLRLDSPLYNANFVVVSGENTHPDEIEIRMIQGKKAKFQEPVWKLLKTYEGFIPPHVTPDGGWGEPGPGDVRVRNQAFVIRKSGVIVFPKSARQWKPYKTMRPMGRGSRPGTVPFAFPKDCTWPWTWV